jgi:hypothetical protein
MGGAAGKGGSIEQRLEQVERKLDVLLWEISNLRRDMSKGQPGGGMGMPPKGPMGGSGGGLYGPAGNTPAGPPTTPPVPPSPGSAAPSASPPKTPPVPSGPGLSAPPTTPKTGSLPMSPVHDKMPRYRIRITRIETIEILS